MDTITRRSTVGSVALLAFLFFAPAFALEIQSTSELQGRVYAKSAPVPPGEFLLLTQSLDPLTIVGNAAVACNAGGMTADNRWYRVYDLDGDHALSGEVCALEIEYAVETASGGPQQVELLTSCLNAGDPLTNANIDAGMVGQTTVTQSDADLIFETAAIGGCCDADTQDMIVGLRSEDCIETGSCFGFVIGANFLGEIGLSYISAPDCGVVQPMDLSFFASHIILNVRVDEPVEPPGEPIQKLIPDDNESLDRFGFSVALDSGTALVGAIGEDENGVDAGAAYVFVRSGGQWTEQARLLAPDGSPDDRFGFSVALDGDTALVGARDDNDLGEDSGSAHVFVRENGTWSWQAKLVPSDLSAFDRFGDSVALDGDTALIGSLNGAAAYTFVRLNGLWFQEAKLLPGGPGTPVALEGNAAVIGYRGVEFGRASVFIRSGSSWILQAILEPSDPVFGGMFGSSVALNGDTVLIGSRAGGDGGAAYVFVSSGGTWTQQAKLVASDGASGDSFGESSVSLRGDTALIGSYHDDDQGVNSGSAYVFRRSGAIWTEQAKFVAADGVALDDFGTSVATDGHTFLVGTPMDDDNGSNSGSVYVFPPDVDADPVPATGAVGALLTLLAILGSGVYFLGRTARRRVG